MTPLFTVITFDVFDSVFRFFLALIITIIIESVILIVIAEDSIREVSSKKILKVAVGINLITNPLLQLTVTILSYYISDMFTIKLFLEIIVIIVEAAMLKNILNLSKGKAFSISLVINFISALFGYIIFTFIIWIFGVFIENIYEAIYNGLTGAVYQSTSIGPEFDYNEFTFE
jgi:hypothetical protein